MRKPPEVYFEPQQRKAHERLERRLRARLRGVKHVAAPGIIKGYGGGADYTDDRVDITWDPLQYDALSLMVHEALHPLMEESLKAVGDLEESAIEGIAFCHVKYIRESKSRRLWWSRAIKARLSVEGFRRWLKEQGDD